MNDLVATMNELMTLEVRRIIGGIIAELTFELPVCVVTHRVTLQP